jgi:hypothetical protein
MVPPPMRPNEQAFKWTLGEMRLWVPAPHIVFCTMIGHGQASVMDAFAAAAPPAPESRTQYLLYDLWELENYESALRQRMTRWVLDRRPRVVALHCLLRSRIVAMGVAVANLALGGIITSHTTRAPFQAAFERALAEPPPPPPRPSHARPR